ncbi:MAG TPA: pyruvate, phosphate dikinase [Candidatus Megaira endosymbiont of Nemacystus decipiens]|nr:pyruvate, phosphate dikinase [Candidatus Megaera endosymbiont of Nemacystus decipiens]
MTKLLYFFSRGFTEGDASMKSVLGGKGANLAQMCKLDLPIPPGFTISTALCEQYSCDTGVLNQDLIDNVNEYIAKLEKETGKVFGGTQSPLLISVRSGAEISMPGMMDTILNLGINDEVACSLAELTQNPRFAYDSYRRFIEMFGSVVLGIPHYHFEDILENCKLDNDYTRDSDLGVEDLKYLIKQYKSLVKKITGKELESEPSKQLINAIEAVLKSWNSSRAITYRSIENITNISGTAVNIQSMVFGNRNNESATGVVFTRDPSTGNKSIFGEFLINAQGEDVVAGVRTPNPLQSSEKNSMQQIMPQQYEHLLEMCRSLEKYFCDMQDIEFTIENGELFLLQTRSGKRSAAAAVKIAVDMAEEGVISKQDSIMSIETESLNQLLHTNIDHSSTNNKKIAKGLPASPGAGMGIAVFSASEAEDMSLHHKVILVRNDTSPEDIKGMHVAEGIITARGGMTSHAAVVARGLGKPCVCGVSGIKINESERSFVTKDGVLVSHGDFITIDGSSGDIIKGKVNLIQPKFSEEFNTLLSWCDEEKKMDIRANAETPLDASMSLKFGAVGIGLCRTEHMFFDDKKISLIREMIIATSLEKRNSAIEKLKPMQVEDFKELFKTMSGLPINIRLLDPPLHEFLPTAEKDKEDLLENLQISIGMIEERLKELQESNPMLGHRGCRLGISHPEIYKMQVEAILDAVYEVKCETGDMSKLELMIPLISALPEILFIKDYVQKIINQKEKEYSIKFNIKLGTMIELPRSALISDKIAEHVDYFSFGSNDLTQTTYGISRDDIGSFLPNYLENNIFKDDPFSVLDEEGVGELIKISISKGKNKNPKLSFGVCGEHAGNPQSIRFFDSIGLGYISCSPYRIPIARVAAAQSNIINNSNKKK